METNWPKIGNEKPIKYLQGLVSEDNASGAYIFIGPDDLGKSTIALAFARNLMGDALQFETSLNSDLHIIEPEEGKKTISIEQVRELIATLSLSSFLNSYKIAIIKKAQLLGKEAQNALLKTLEEPQKKVIIILLASSEEGILPTILSRSQKLHFQAVPAETIYDYLISEYGAKRTKARDLANLSLGRPLRAVDFLENDIAYEKYIKRAKILLSFFSLNINERLSHLSEVYNDKTYSSFAVDSAKEIISIYEGLWRDLLLLHYESSDRVQHSAILDDLNKTLVSLRGGLGDDKIGTYLLERFKLAAMAREYLDASVNPYMVLEQLAINL